MTNRFISVVGVLACVIGPALAVTPQTTTTTLALSNSAVSIGTAVTLTATVAAGGTGVSPGLVTFEDGKTVVGSAQLIAGGTAAIKVRLGLGAHSITANFAGTNTYASSNSSAQPLTITGIAASATAMNFSGK